MDSIIQMKCTKHDVFALSRTLSDADCNELKASGALKVGESLEECLTRCVVGSEKTYAIRSHGAILAIGGYTENGNCWFLSSKYLAKLSQEKRKEFRAQLMENLLNTLKLFPVLCNMAWAKNTQHLRLIESCGGRIGTSGYAPSGEEFVYFEFRREDYPQLN